MEINVKKGEAIMSNFDKNMYFANFNITFGSEEKPMLEHFEDIIYPAFCSNYKRGIEEKTPVFYFDDIRIKEYNNELVMVGNYIKNTKYEIFTSVMDGKLQSTPSSIPTAPYSRFIVFLKNHRMVLVKNESSSPDVRSFQSTVRKMLMDYTIKSNRKIKDKSKKMPKALVNIVDIPLPIDIENALKDVKKIKLLKLRFFPLNNDINFHPWGNDINKAIKYIGSKNAYVQFPSPKSKENVQKLIEDNAGLSVATLEVEDNNGNTTKIKDGRFNSNTKISFSGNISGENDAYIINMSKNSDAVNKTSEANQTLYDKIKLKIKSLIQ